MKIKTFFVSFILPALLFFCATSGDGGNGAASGQELYFVSPAETIVIERPVYIPEGTPVPRQAQASGQQAVRNSNAEGILLPSEYSRAAMIYDYDPDWVYEVYAQPLRVTDVRMESGERVLETPFVSDSERWLLGAGTSYENGVPVQHIYVKPVQASLEASLIINTDRRVYHLILRSYASVYMPMVRWNYPNTGLPNFYISELPNSPGSPAPYDPEISGAAFDPRYVSFDYAVRSGFFPLFSRKPPWFPELVYDDGSKTYIVFPRGVLQASFPAIFDNRNNVVNYRVSEHIAVIDRLVEKITVKLDGREAVIEKRRSR